MTVVVADTSPIRYLAVIDSTEILPRLYGRIVMPKAVLEELAHPHAPEPARRFAEAMPSWVDVLRLAQPVPCGFLDPGEAEALVIGAELKAELILLDEREARAEAVRRGFMVSGTIGILEQAASRGFVDLPTMLERLSQTNFRIDPRFYQEALARDRGRRERGVNPRP